MPNWCDNAATLTASKEKIDALVAVLENKDDQQVFQHLRPRPESEENNWYEWNCTKWDISLIDYDRYDDETIWISFETAWAPPLTLYEFLFENDWHVDAVYHEGGMGYCGKWEDGESDEYNYDMDDLESLEALPEEIQDFTGLIDYYHSRQEELQMEAENEAYEETVTEWYPVEVNPERVGYYETKEGNNWPFYKFAMWNGKKWTIDNKKPKEPIAFWRGLKEEPLQNVIETMFAEAGFGKVESK
jgi:hypothetical protein